MLHVSLLGEQAIISDRPGSVRIRSTRALVLVTFLVTHAGSPQPRPRIAGVLWPESTDAQALTNLRRELHHLRNLLGDEPSLSVTPRDLCWRDTKTCRVDVRIFEVGYRTLMQLQADLGDRAGAVSTYHHCASVLERELGVVPDTATRKAFQRLMAQARQAVASAGTIEPRAGLGRRRHRSSAVRPSSACSRMCGGPPRRAGVVSRWSAGARASERPAWWPRSRRWHGCRAPWWRAASASGPRGGWRWPRWRTGCETMRSSQQRRLSTPPGALKSAG